MVIGKRGFLDCYWQSVHGCFLVAILIIINFVQQTKEEKVGSSKKRLGLKNLGNTCFMNSVRTSQGFAMMNVINSEFVRCFRVFQTLRSFVMLSKPCPALMKDR